MSENATWNIVLKNGVTGKAPWKYLQKNNGKNTKN